MKRTDFDDEQIQMFAALKFVQSGKGMTPNNGYEILISYAIREGLVDFDRWMNKVSLTKYGEEVLKNYEEE